MRNNKNYKEKSNYNSEEEKQSSKIKKILLIFVFILLIIALQFGISKYISTTDQTHLLYFYEYRIQLSEIVLSTENYTGGEVTVEITTQKPGLSIQYQLGDSEEWIDYVGPFSIGENVKINTRLVSEPDNFTGPITSKEIKNIAVAKIGDQYFKTLAAAIDACAENAGDNKTKIEMLANIEENVVIPEGKNIVLDLCGATIKNKSTNENGTQNTNPTIAVNGKLNLIDSAKNENGSLQGEGKVTSTTAEAIKVLGNGNFVLGTNESGTGAENVISIIKPVVEGNTYGVAVEGNAKFEFYDGIISGKTNAINGIVAATPEYYEVVANKENDYEVAILSQAATITFDKNADESVNITLEYETATKVIGQPIESLPTAQREGYVFVGWFTAKENGEQITAETIVEGTATYYAIWEAYTYTIEYNANGGSGTTQETNAKYDEEIIISDSTFTAPEGYTFKEWNTNAERTGTTYNPGDKVINLSNEQSAIIQLYAIWEDTIAPSKTAPTGTGTTSTIIVNCNQTDAGSGIDETTIQYAIFNKDTNADGKPDAWSEWQNSNIFENLSTNTEYEVKTQVTDKNGNGPVESEIGKISTSKIENGSIEVRKENAQGEIIKPETSAENKENQVNSNIYVDITPSTSGTTTVTVKTPDGQTTTYTEDTTITTQTGMYEITVETTDGTNTVTDTYYVFVDKTVPTAQPTTLKTTNTITVNANAQDAESGIADVTYTIKKGDEIVETNKIGEFAGLEDNTEYTVEITITDKAGNTTTKIENVKTEELVAGSIAFTETTSGEIITPANTSSEAIVWVNENINAVLTQGSTGTTTYEITAPDGIKTTYEQDVQIVATEGNYVVTLRTTDGTNTKTVEYYFSVDKTVPTVTINPNEKDYTLQVGESSLNLETTISVVENESGLVITKYAISTSNTEKPQDSEFKDFVAGSQITENLSGGEYYVWVMVQDNAGNIAKTELLDAIVSGEFNIGYTVEYNLNGGTGEFASFRKPHGQNVGLATEKPVRDRYIFKGWSEFADTSEINYAVGGTYTKNESKVLYAVWGEVVASTTIGEEVTLYESVQEAIDAAGTNAGATVTLLKDEIVESVIVAAGQDIILNINGKTLSNSTTNTIKTLGNLTITGEGSINGATDTILNEGTDTLTILSGAINTSGECAIKGTGSGKIIIGNEGNESITNPSITGAVRGQPADIYLHSGIITPTTGKGISGRNNITITGGYIKSSVNDYLVIGSTSDSVITITGGVIEQTSRAEAVTTGNETEAKIIISGGKIIGNSYAAVNNKKGEIIITGGEIAGENGIRSENGITKVSGATITGTNYGIYTATGNVEISGTAEITGQTGVYITDTGNVTIGDNSNEVSITTPRIQGKQAGIIVNSNIKEFNFYDGILIGADSISGIDEPTATPDGYCVENGTETIDGVQYETSYLTTKNYEITQGATLADVVQVGDYVNYDASSNGVKTFTSSDCLAGTSISDTISTANSFYSSAPAQCPAQWRVLSVDKERGLVELMAADPTVQTVTLTGGDGFVNAETVLNNIGAIYGSGKGATDGRSIAVEDIEQYSSFDKTKYKNEYSNYGGTKDCTIGYYYKEIKDEKGNVIGYETTTTQATSSNPVTMTQTHYTYTASTYFSNSIIYDMIFKNATSTTSNKTQYWLASRCVNFIPDYCRFDMMRIEAGMIRGYAVFNSFLEPENQVGTLAQAVVPVVTLQTNIKTSGKDANGVWQLSFEETTSNSNYSSTLQSAIEKASAGSTIKVLNGIEETTAPTVPAEKGLVLDLNGKTTTLNGVSLSNNGGLTITGEGKLTSANADTIVNSGRLKKSGNGTIENTGASNVAINNTGMVNVLEGTVTGGLKAINTTSGIVTIGANDGTVSTNNPIINGADTGVSVGEGKLNFYDGAVKGTSGKSIVGEVSDVATGYAVVNMVADGVETSYLKQQYVITYDSNGEETPPATQYKIHDENITLSSEILYRDYYVFKGWATAQNATTPEYLPGATYTANASATLYAVWVDAIASTKVGEKVTFYDTVQGAIDAAGTNAGATVTLLKDEIAESITVAADQDILLNLNGKKLANSGAQTITNNGTLTLNGEGTVTSSNQYTIKNYGTFEKYGNSTIEYTGTVYYALRNAGTANLYEGTIISNIIGVENKEGGKVLVDGITIQSNKEALRNNIANTASETLSNPSVIIKSGLIESTNTYGIYSSENRVMDIQGGTIRGTIGIQVVYNGIVTITDAKVEGNVGISNYNNGQIFVNEGSTIIGNTSYGITNGRDGTVTVTGGTITGNTYGIIGQGTEELVGTINITGGKISGKTAGVSQAKEDTLIIGTDDGVVDIEKPVIISGTQGVSNIKEGTFEFYDGIINGPDGYSITGTVTDTPTGYRVVNGTQTIDGTTYETAYLDNTYYITFNENYENAPTTTKDIKYNTEIGELPTPTRENYIFDGWYTAQTDGEKITKETVITADTTFYAHWLEVVASTTIGDVTTNYASVQNAIDAAGTNAGATVTLLKDEIAETVTIAKNQDINIDINGKTWVNIGDQTITNSGKLTLKGDGKVTSSSRYTIYNNGTFEKYGNSTIEYTGTINNALRNSGTLNLYEGNIVSEKIGIENKDDGKVLLSGINIYAKQRAINNQPSTSVETISNPGVLITSGLIESDNITINGLDNRAIVIQGGTIKSNNDKAIYYEGNSKIQIDNAKVEGTMGIDCNGAGEIIINEGSYIIGRTTYGINNKASSTVTINGGTVEGYDTGIRNMTAYVFANEGSNIIGTTNEGIFNSIDGIVEITGGTVSGKNCGIRNDGSTGNNTAKVIMTGGKITSESIGVRSFDGTLIIGTDDETISTETPYVFAKNEGISVSTNVNFEFYDGIAIGLEGKSITGTVIKIPDGYSVVKGTETIDGVEYETSYLKQQYTITYNSNGEETAPVTQYKIHDQDLTLTSDILTRDYYVFKGWATTEDATTPEYLPGATYTANSSATLYAVWVDAVASTTVGEHTTFYDTVQGAIDSAGNNKGAVVTLLKDEITESVTVAAGQDIVIDLNGKTWAEKGSDKVILNYGNITVIGNGKITSSSQYTISNFGTFEKYGESIIEQNKESSTYCIRNTGILNLYEGKLISAEIGVENKEGGKVFVDGITIETNKVAIRNYSTFNTLLEPAININSGKIISNDTSAIYNVNEGLVNISGGEIVCENGSGVFNVANATINIIGGTVKGTIYGIHMGSVDGILIIGIDEEIPEVSTTSPKIMGGSSGVHNRVNATFNFYDGIIMGSTDRSIIGEVTDTPTGYSVVNGTETIDGITYETAYLDNIRYVTFNENYDNAPTTIKGVKYGTAIGELTRPKRENYVFKGWYTAQTDGEKITKDTIITEDITYYAHLEEAVASTTIGGTTTYHLTIGDAISTAGTHAGATVTLLKDEISESVTVASDKDIVIDLNEKTWINSGTVPAITNNGTIKMQGNGKVIATGSATSYAIVNNGTFEKYGNGIIEYDNTANYALRNAGVAKLYEGKIISGRIGIENKESAKLLIDGITIESNNISVRNVSTLNSLEEPAVKILSGEIISNHVRNFTE